MVTWISLLQLQYQRNGGSSYSNALDAPSGQFRAVQRSEGIRNSTLPRRKRILLNAGAHTKEGEGGGQRNGVVHEPLEVP